MRASRYHEGDQGEQKVIIIRIRRRITKPGIRSYEVGIASNRSR